MIKPITFTITSCNRIDLLEKTLNSFFKINTYPIDEYIISDDSGDEKIQEYLVKNFGNKFIIISNNQQLGLSKSLDNLFSKSKNEYIFHCEDDWFFEKNPNFILESLNILEENSNIHQVWIRHTNDHPHPIKPEVFKTSNNVPYRILSRDFAWNGYSWNPGLRRKSDYLKMFPNGISEFGDEHICSEHTRNFNYIAASLENTSCYHLGYNNRTKNFTI